MSAYKKSYKPYAPKVNKRYKGKDNSRNPGRFFGDHNKSSIIPSTYFDDYKKHNAKPRPK